MYRSSAMSDCTICKKDVPDSASEAWTTPDGNVVHVARTADACALVNTSLGEFVICESCYRRGLPPFFTREDAAEIHYEFGLEYRDRRQFDLSVQSLTQACAISETADNVAALAYSENELGNRELAIAHYRRALEIDPSHFMSRENLRNMHSGGRGG